MPCLAPSYIASFPIVCPTAMPIAIRTVSAGGEAIAAAIMAASASTIGMSVGYAIVGLFVATWVISIGIWRFAHIEERWSNGL